MFKNIVEIYDNHAFCEQYDNGFQGLKSGISVYNISVQMDGAIIAADKKKGGKNIINLKQIFKDLKFRSQIFAKIVKYFLL